MTFSEIQRREHSRINCNRWWTPLPYPQRSRFHTSKAKPLLAGASRYHILLCLDASAQTKGLF
jgi:hypothetical protein